jgi:hypothetical protein
MDDGDDIHEALVKLKGIVMANLPDADGDEPWWALEKAATEIQWRVLKQAAEMLEGHDSVLSGFDDMTVRDAYQTASSAVYVEKPLLENLLSQFADRESAILTREAA